MMVNILRNQKTAFLMLSTPLDLSYFTKLDYYWVNKGLAYQAEFEHQTFQAIILRSFTSLKIIQYSKLNLKLPLAIL